MKIVAILYMLTIWPNGHHTVEHVGAFDDRNICRLNAGIHNKMQGDDHHVFICRNITIYPEGTEFVN